MVAARPPRTPVPAGDAFTLEMVQTHRPVDALQQSAAECELEHVRSQLPRAFDPLFEG